ncbi:hypothetical protein F4801DRAFT_107389 [Xylaria longipes]|nr:hypothetical protein F4801DRAFT_107389 [Xylaria longipes]
MPESLKQQYDGVVSRLEAIATNRELLEARPGDGIFADDMLLRLKLWAADVQSDQEVFSWVEQITQISVPLRDRLQHLHQQCDVFYDAYKRAGGGEDHKDPATGSSSAPEDAIASAKHSLRQAIDNLMALTTPIKVAASVPKERRTSETVDRANQISTETIPTPSINEPLYVPSRKKSKAREFTSMIVSILFSILLFISSWARGMINGIARQISRRSSNKRKVFSEVRPTFSQSIEAINELIRTNTVLAPFFGDKIDYIVELALKAIGLEQDTSTCLGCEKYLLKTMMVSLYQQVIYCDDSYSMEREGRWEAQSRLVGKIAQITTRILPDGEGVALRFINQDVDPSSNLTVEDIKKIMEGTSWAPNGATQIGTYLKSKILEPLVYSKLKLNQLERPLLISVITDGMPSEENNSAFVDAIKECGNRLKIAGLPRESVKFMIGQIGTDPRATKFLDDLREKQEIADTVFVATEQLDKKFADLYAIEKDLDGWLIETLFSPFKDAEGKKDQ